MSTTGGQPIKIAVLGSGTWGIALARVLSLNGHRITVWSKFPEECRSLDETRRAPNLKDIVIPGGIRFTADPTEAVSGTEYILTVVPSIYMRDTIRLFASCSPENAIWKSPG